MDNHGDANCCIIALGSNLGDRNQYLKSALSCIAAQVGPLTAVSSVYQTAPWFGDKAKPAYTPDYFNALAVVETELDPPSILRRLSLIELRLGRSRSSSSNRFSSRTLDLDIVAIGRCVFQHADLNIPHPSMHLRDFVLVPLAELMPAWKHPLLNLSADELLHRLKQSDSFEPTIVQTISEQLLSRDRKTI